MGDKQPRDTAWPVPPKAAWVRAGCAAGGGDTGVYSACAPRAGGDSGVLRARTPQRGGTGVGVISVSGGSGGACAGCAAGVGGTEGCSLSPPGGGGTGRGAAPVPRGGGSICSLCCSRRRHGGRGVHSHYHRERRLRVMCKLCCVEQWQWGVRSLSAVGGDSRVYIVGSLGQVTTPL